MGIISAESIPRQTRDICIKLVKCTTQQAIFVGKYPVPRFYYDGQMRCPRIPSPSDQYTKILVAIF